MTARALLRVCAGVLAVLGVAAVVVLPTARSRAEARLSVATPFTTSDVLRALRRVAPGATVRADGPQAVIAVTASNRRTARARVSMVAHAGIEAGLRRFVAAAAEQAAGARNAEAQAAAQLATLADRTGLTDPTPAYQRLQGVVQGLELQRELAAALGAPTGALDASVAANQQAMFELRAQVTRREELVLAQARARQQELNAPATRDAATIAARFATVVVAEHTTHRWPRVLLAGVAFVLAAIVLLAGELSGRLQLRLRSHFLSRRGLDASPIGAAAPRRARPQPDVRVRSEPPPMNALNATYPDETGPGDTPVVTPVEQRSAYLRCVPERERDFYLALAASQPDVPDAAASVSGDLVRDEELDENRARAASPQPVDEPGGSDPAKASVEAPAAVPPARGTEPGLSGPPATQRQPRSEGNSAASRRRHRRT